MHKKFPRMIFAIVFSQSPILPEHFTEKAPFASKHQNLILYYSTNHLDAHHLHSGVKKA